MYNIWVDILSDMLATKQITPAKGLKKAVVDKLISPTEYKAICGTDYTAPAQGGTT